MKAQAWLMPHGSELVHHEDRPGLHYLVRQGARSAGMLVVAGPFCDAPAARRALAEATRDGRVPPPPRSGPWADVGLSLARAPALIHPGALPRFGQLSGGL